MSSGFPNCVSISCVCVRDESLKPRLTTCDPIGCSPPGSPVDGHSPGKSPAVGGLPCPPAGNLPDPEIEPTFLSLLHGQVGSLPPAPPGKPCPSWVQSLSCLGLFATPGTVAARLLCPWDSPGKTTRVGSLSLLQGIFLTREPNPRLLYLLHRRPVLHH